MESELSIIGDNQRKSRYDPNLAEQFVKDMQEQERLEEIRARKSQLTNKTPEIKQPSKITVPSSGRYSFITDKNFIDEYNGIVKINYDDAGVLKVLSWNKQEGVVTGSNPFAVVLVNQILQKNGIRTATQAELEQILREGDNIGLEGHYEDSALVWRSNAGPNKYLAEDISAQFKRIGVKMKDGTPYIIPLFGLRLRKDNNSPNKLAFDVTDKLSYFEAPILNSKSGSFINPNEMDESTGLPTKVYGQSVNGNRQLYTRDSGLSRLGLGRNLYVVSGDDDVAGSDDDGRVVLASAEGAAFGNSKSGGKQ